MGQGQHKLIALKEYTKVDKTLPNLNLPKLQGISRIHAANFAPY